MRDGLERVGRKDGLKNAVQAQTAIAAERPVIIKLKIAVALVFLSVPGIEMNLPA